MPVKGRKKALKPKKMVTFPSEMRKKFPWLDAAIASKREKEIDKKRKGAEQGKKPNLEELRKAVDQRDELQKQINGLQEKIKEVSRPIIRYWAEHGDGEIEGESGKTLVYSSATVSVDSSWAQRKMKVTEFQSVSMRMIDPHLALLNGAKKKAIADCIIQAVDISRVSVSIKSPSSRSEKED